MAEHSPAIKLRFQQDHERGRLMDLDRLDGGKRCLLWSLYTFAESYEPGQNVLDFGLDSAMQPCKVAVTEKGIWPMAKASKKNEAVVAKALLEALSFISMATTKDDLPYQSYMVLHSGFAIAFNGQMAAGYPIAEDLQCCPKFDLFKAAINKCAKSLSITQLENGKLSVKGEKLRAVIDCLPIDDFPYTCPDPVAVKPNGERAAIDDRLKVAFAVCGNVVSETGNRMIECALMLNGNICTATDGRVLMQYRHGIDLPPIDMIVPKIFAASVGKQKLALKEFGWTEGRSITLYFENGAWIKTLLYEDKYPNVEPIINVASDAKPVTHEFFEAIATVDEHNEGVVTFADKKVVSHKNENMGAQFECDQIQAGLTIDNDYVKIVAPFTTSADMTTYNDRLIVFGENMRGVVLGCRPIGESIGENVKRVNADDSARVHEMEDKGFSRDEIDDEIPF